MAELTKKHYLVRKVLDELDLVPDWQNVRSDLVNLILKDMALKKVIDFGYEQRPGEISRRLIEDLEAIQDSSRDAFFEKPLNPRIQEVLQEYKESESFGRITANYFQPELYESMFSVEN